MIWFLAASALAQTADGLTPSVEASCSDYGGAAQGLCMAICEARDREAAAQTAGPARGDLLARFAKLTGAAPPCATREYLVELVYTGDDSSVVHLNGSALPFAFGDQFWSHEVSRVFSLPSGEHVIGLNVYDVGRGAVGLAYLLYVDGELVGRSDDLGARITAQDPGSDWSEVAFDDSSWGRPARCTRPWGALTLPELVATQVRWTWTDSACEVSQGSALETWTRLSLSLP